MSVINFEDLKSHLGHKLEVVMYGDENVAIECTKCKEVLLDFDKTSNDENAGYTLVCNSDLKKLAEKFYPVGSKIVCNEESDELKDIVGVIREVRFGAEKDTENSGIFELECELFPTEEQEDSVNEKYKELDYGFGFDLVILNEDMVRVVSRGGENDA